MRHAASDLIIRIKQTFKHTNVQRLDIATKLHQSNNINHPFDMVIHTSQPGKATKQRQYHSYLYAPYNEHICEYLRQSYKAISILHVSTCSLRLADIPIIIISMHKNVS